MPSRTFEDVEVWKKAHKWVLGVYKLTEGFPKHELFGLVSQLRRAAVSAPANFAEGFKKRTNPDKVRFYNIAQGSLEECRYYLILSRPRVRRHGPVDGAVARSELYVGFVQPYSYDGNLLQELT